MLSTRLLVVVAALYGCAASTALSQEHPEKRVRQPLPTAEQIAELPPDGGPEFNRLVFEQSPYLLQHARNPVDWHPWGEEAFRLAREQDKPVFLSIGYSTCHWCHVMEHESFEDEEVAELMNREFICIKVDREERPDIDQVYMTVTQAMTGHGGWPMTVVMTPEKKPFFAGTYFPKASRTGRTGMMDLVPALGNAWRDQRDGVLERAEQTTTSLAQWTSGTPGPDLQRTILDETYGQFSSTFDPTYGGFGDAPKFPVPHNLSLLLRYNAREPDSSALAMVERTLQEMRKGGIWDHVGFGFHRYSTDPQWLVPHFEKMLYDQAMLAMAYTEAWQITDDPLYRRTADEIFTYVLRDMTAPEGGFYSAEDADSEGVEGLFYVWSTAELKEVLGDEDGRFAAELWNADLDGNFREEATGSKTGTNILHLQQSLEQLERQYDTTEEALRERIESMRQRLFDVREKRIHPLKDDKILTDWNGLMMAAFAKAGRAMGEARYTVVATRAADFALTTLRDENGRLFKRYRQGDAGLPAMIEDYAFLTWGLLEVYESTGTVRYLEAAVELTDSAIAHFWDDDQGGFFTAPDDGEELIVRAKEAYDGAIPSGNSVMAWNLLRLGRVTARVEFEEKAQEVMRAFSAGVKRSPRGHTLMLAALDFMVGPTFEIVVAGNPEGEDTRAMLAALHQRYLPNKVVVVRPEDAAAIVELAPYTEAQGSQGGKATAYVCQNYACKAPTTEIETMLEHLEAGKE